MKLSELRTGEKGIIIKIKGSSEFRKRIIEMGFIKGKEIKVIKYAPLKDPIEYEIMNYHISLRRSEAELIEIEVYNKPIFIDNNQVHFTHSENDYIKRIKEKTHTINIALVGNPNSGKTTLFNYLTGSAEHVGNYEGVTVDLKKGKIKKFGYTFEIVDLPGTYSLSAYTSEEVLVRNFLFYEMPDIVINIVDGSNLERNFYLTTQLIDINLPCIIALNMYDEMLKRGDKIDIKQLSKLFGMPIVPTIASTGFGLDELLKKIIELYEELPKSIRSIKINYGLLEKSIEELTNIINQEENSLITNIISPRFIAIKLFENDPKIRELVSLLPNSKEIFQKLKELVRDIERNYKIDTEELIADARYGFIAGALKETYSEGKFDKFEKTKIIDSIVTNKFLGFPIFFFVLWFTFQTTFVVGNYLAGWLEWLINQLGQFIVNYMPEGTLKDLIYDGIISGVGSVLVFLPNIMILFLFISIMEDTGYMARVAFIMDKFMHRIGLHGKSFIPLIMGFGCNVPAVMSTRTLQNRSDRLITMLIIPFMSCSARLPVYILLLGTFFPKFAGTIILFIYLLGIIVAILTAFFLKKTFFRKVQAPFVMELPPYRMPTSKVILKHMWHKSKQYLYKMGGIILVASIIIWTLEYFPRTKNYDQQLDNLVEKMSYTDSYINKDSIVQIAQLKLEAEREYNSYIAQIGRTLQPIMEPLGFDWKMTVAILAGFSAKEIVISTLSVLYQSPDNNILRKKLETSVYTYGPKKGEKIFTIPVVVAFLIFILLYVPCVATIAAIAKESGTWKWAFFSVVYTISVAWILAYIGKTITEWVI